MNTLSLSTPASAQHAGNPELASSLIDELRIPEVDEGVIYLLGELARFGEVFPPDGLPENLRDLVDHYHAYLQKHEYVDQLLKDDGTAGDWLTQAFHDELLQQEMQSRLARAGGDADRQQQYRQATRQLGNAEQRRVVRNLGTIALAEILGRVHRDDVARWEQHFDVLMREAGLAEDRGVMSVVVALESRIPVQDEMSSVLDGLVTQSEEAGVDLAVEESQIKEHITLEYLLGQPWQDDQGASVTAALDELLLELGIRVITNWASDVSVQEEADETSTKADHYVSLALPRLGGDDPSHAEVVAILGVMRIAWENTAARIFEGIGLGEGFSPKAADELAAFAQRYRASIEARPVADSEVLYFWLADAWRARVARERLYAMLANQNQRTALADRLNRILATQRPRITLAAAQGDEESEAVPDPLPDSDVQWFLKHQPEVVAAALRACRIEAIGWKLSNGQLPVSLLAHIGKPVPTDEWKNQSAEAAERIRLLISLLPPVDRRLLALGDIDNLDIARLIEQLADPPLVVLGEAVPGTTPLLDHLPQQLHGVQVHTLWQSGRDLRISIQVGPSDRYRPVEVGARFDGERFVFDLQGMPLVERHSGADEVASSYLLSLAEEGGWVLDDGRRLPIDADFSTDFAEVVSAVEDQLEQVTGAALDAAWEDITKQLPGVGPLISFQQQGGRLIIQTTIVLGEPGGGTDAESWGAAIPVEVSGQLTVEGLAGLRLPAAQVRLRRPVRISLPMAEGLGGVFRSARIDAVGFDEDRHLVTTIRGASGQAAQLTLIYDEASGWTLQPDWAESLALATANPLAVDVAGGLAVHYDPSTGDYRVLFKGASLPNGGVDEVHVEAQVTNVTGTPTIDRARVQMTFVDPAIWDARFGLPSGLVSLQGIRLYDGGVEARVTLLGAAIPTWVPISASHTPEALGRAVVAAWLERVSNERTETPIGSIEAERLALDSSDQLTGSLIVHSPVLGRLELIIKYKLGQDPGQETVWRLARPEEHADRLRALLRTLLPPDADVQLSQDSSLQVIDLMLPPADPSLTLRASLTLNDQTVVPIDLRMNTHGIRVLNAEDAFVNALESLTVQQLGQLLHHIYSAETLVGMLEGRTLEGLGRLIRVRPTPPGAAALGAEQNTANWTAASVQFDLVLGTESAGLTIHHLVARLRRPGDVGGAPSVEFVLPEPLLDNLTLHLGETPGEELAMLNNIAGLFASPTLLEGFGMVLRVEPRSDLSDQIEAVFSGRGEGLFFTVTVEKKSERQELDAETFAIGTLSASRGGVQFEPADNDPIAELISLFGEFTAGPLTVSAWELRETGLSGIGHLQLPVGRVDGTFHGIAFRNGTFDFSGMRIELDAEQQQRLADLLWSSCVGQAALADWDRLELGEMSAGVTMSRATVRCETAGSAVEAEIAADLQVQALAMGVPLQLDIVGVRVDSTGRVSVDRVNQRAVAGSFKAFGGAVAEQLAAQLRERVLSPGPLLIRTGRVVVVTNRLPEEGPGSGDWLQVDVVVRSNDLGLDLDLKLGVRGGRVRLISINAEANESAVQEIDELKNAMRAALDTVRTDVADFGGDFAVLPWVRIATEVTKVELQENYAQSVVDLIDFEVVSTLTIDEEAVPAEDEGAQQLVEVLQGQEMPKITVAGLPLELRVEGRAEVTDALAQYAGGLAEDAIEQWAESINENIRELVDSFGDRFSSDAVTVTVEGDPEITIENGRPQVKPFTLRLTETTSGVNVALTGVGYDASDNRLTFQSVDADVTAFLAGLIGERYGKVVIVRQAQIIDGQVFISAALAFSDAFVLELDELSLPLSGSDSISNRFLDAAKLSLGGPRRVELASGLGLTLHPRIAAGELTADFELDLFEIPVHGRLRLSLESGEHHVRIDYDTLNEMLGPVADEHLKPLLGPLLAVGVEVSDIKPLLDESSPFPMGVTFDVSAPVPLFSDGVRLIANELELTRNGLAVPEEIRILIDNDSSETPTFLGMFTVRELDMGYRGGESRSIGGTIDLEMSDGFQLKGRLELPLGGRGRIAFGGKPIIFGQSLKDASFMIDRATGAFEFDLDLTLFSSIGFTGGLAYDPPNRRFGGHGAGRVLGGGMAQAEIELDFLEKTYYIRAVIDMKLERVGGSVRIMPGDIEVGGEFRWKVVDIRVLGSRRKIDVRAALAYMSMVNVTVRFPSLDTMNGERILTLLRNLIDPTRWIKALLNPSWPPVLSPFSPPGSGDGFGEGEDGESDSDGDGDSEEQSDAESESEGESEPESLPGEQIAGSEEDGPWQVRLDGELMKFYRRNEADAFAEPPTFTVALDKVEWIEARPSAEQMKMTSVGEGEGSFFFTIGDSERAVIRVSLGPDVWRELQSPFEFVHTRKGWFDPTQPPDPEDPAPEPEPDPLPGPPPVPSPAPVPGPPPIDPEIPNIVHRGGGFVITIREEGDQVVGYHGETVLFKYKLSDRDRTVVWSAGLSYGEVLQVTDKGLRLRVIRPTGQSPYSQEVLYGTIDAALTEGGLVGAGEGEVFRGPQHGTVAWGATLILDRHRCERVESYLQAPDGSRYVLAVGNYENPGINTAKLFRITPEGGYSRPDWLRRPEPMPRAWFNSNQALLQHLCNLGDVRLISEGRGEEHQHPYGHFLLQVGGDDSENCLLVVWSDDAASCRLWELSLTAAQRDDLAWHPGFVDTLAKLARVMEPTSDESVPGLIRVSAAISFPVLTSDVYVVEAIPTGGDQAPITLLGRRSGSWLLSHQTQEGLGQSVLYDAEALDKLPLVAESEGLLDQLARQLGRGGLVLEVWPANEAEGTQGAVIGVRLGSASRDDPDKFHVTGWIVEQDTTGRATATALPFVRRYQPVAGLRDFCEAEGRVDEILRIHGLTQALDPVLDGHAYIDSDKKRAVGVAFDAGRDRFAIADLTLPGEVDFSQLVDGSSGMFTADQLQERMHNLLCFLAVDAARQRVANRPEGSDTSASTETSAETTQEIGVTAIKSNDTVLGWLLQTPAVGAALPRAVLQPARDMPPQLLDTAPLDLPARLRTLPESLRQPRLLPEENAAGNDTAAVLRAENQVALAHILRPVLDWLASDFGRAEAPWRMRLSAHLLIIQSQDGLHLAARRNADQDTPWADFRHVAPRPYARQFAVMASGAPNANHLMAQDVLDLPIDFTRMQLLAIDTFFARHGSGHPDLIGWQLLAIDYRTIVDEPDEWAWVFALHPVFVEDEEGNESQTYRLRGTRVSGDAPKNGRLFSALLFSDVVGKMVDDGRNTEGYTASLFATDWTQASLNRFPPSGMWRGELSALRNMSDISTSSNSDQRRETNPVP